MQEWGCTCAGEAEESRGSIVDRRGSSTDQYAAAKGTSFASVTPMPRQKLPNLATPRPYNACKVRSLKPLQQILKGTIQHTWMTHERVHITAPA